MCAYDLNSSDAQDVQRVMQDQFPSNNLNQRNTTFAADPASGAPDSLHMKFANGVMPSGPAGGSATGNLGVSGTNSYDFNARIRAGYFGHPIENKDAGLSVTNSISTAPESLGLSTNNSMVQVGDPDWIGFLEHPDQRHSASNYFLSRGAFVAIPQK